MILSVQNLDFSYGTKKALSEISFSMEKGEILCVMGPNGSGKSTLIDTILNLHRPEKGRILLDGTEVSFLSRPAIAKKASYVPQNHSVTFPYTVREMVLMGRNAYVSPFGVPPETDHERCDDALNRVGLLELADRTCNTLSGGELRLVLLARALCQNAPLILMDEPTAHLDYRNELIFLETIGSLCREDGISILLATHAPEQAFYLEARELPVTAMFLKEGSLYQTGRPSEIITPELLQEVYGIRAKIIDSDGEKTILRQKAL